MNQSCKVCSEPAAGFHFGAFTCEGCKSFFGRSYNNVSSISECKNSGKCVIDKKNRTTCKACRLRKCYTVGMSKGGSRYGRRSNWFKIHCLLQEQQQQYADSAGKNCTNGFSDFAAAMQRHQNQQTHAQQAHMSNMLQYPYLYPTAGRVPPTEAAAANPFLSIMHSMPYLGESSTNGANGSGMHLPHFLYPGFHPAAAMAAAANVDHAAAYRAVEMYKHQQRAASVDSAEFSADSQENISESYQEPQEQQEQRKRTASPEILVSGDEDYHSASSLSPNSASSAPMHTIHNPIAVRATPTTNVNTCMNSNTVTHIGPASASTFTKMQSLSPVSECSIGAEATLPVSSANTPTTSSSSSSFFTATVIATITADDAPIDLSMKSLRSSVHSFNQSAVESGGEEESHSVARRKFVHLSDVDSNASSCFNHDDVINSSVKASAEKRTKFNVENTTLSSAPRVYAF